MPIKRSSSARRGRGLLTAILGFLMLPTAAFAMPPDPGEVSGGSNLNPWSIDGALFARDAEGVAGVDIAGACLAAYSEWAAEITESHANIRQGLADLYYDMVDANLAAEAAGEPYPYPSVPPAGTQTETQFVNGWLTFSGIPHTAQEWIEERWEVMEFVPGTEIPCTGTGMLPSPPNGFFGIPPGDEPPDPDPCPVGGELPFSPAIWTWYPEWHENAPEAAGGGTYSGITSWYNLAEGEFVFTFIPIVFGWELDIECLPIFPGREGSDHFIESLPAAELTIVPEGVGLTGAETQLWYDLQDPDRTQVGPLTINVSHRGTDWTLTAHAWIDRVGWDLDFEGTTEDDADWDVWIDFPDNAWYPATPEEYASMGGTPDDPAHIYVFEEKDFYTVATGVTWRGYYVVQSIANISWGFTEAYAPVTRFTIEPYQVDEIVGRRN